MEKTLSKYLKFIDNSHNSHRIATCQLELITPVNCNWHFPKGAIHTCQLRQPGDYLKDNRSKIANHMHSHVTAGKTSQEQKPKNRIGKKHSYPSSQQENIKKSSISEKKYNILAQNSEQHAPTQSNNKKLSVQITRMAENRLRVQTRSMVDNQHTEEETQNQPDKQQPQINRDNPVVSPEHTTPNLD